MVRSVLTKLNRNTVSTDQNFVTFDTNAAIVDVTDTFRVASYPLAIESVNITNVTTLFSLNKEQAQSDARAFISSSAGAGVSLADKTLAVTSSFSGEQSAAGSTFAVEAIRTVNGEFVEALASDVWVDQSNGTTAGYEYDNSARAIYAFGTSTSVDDFDGASHTSRWTGDTSDFTYDSTVTYGGSSHSLKNTSADFTASKDLTADTTNLDGTITLGQRLRFRVRFSDNGQDTGVNTSDHLYLFYFNGTSSTNRTQLGFNLASNDLTSSEGVSFAVRTPLVVRTANPQYFTIPRNEWLTVVIDNKLSGDDIEVFILNSGGVVIYNQSLSGVGLTANSNISLNTFPSFDDYGYETTFWIDELEYFTLASPVVQWKCLEYNPDQAIKSAFIRHKDFVLPDGVTLYVGSANNPDATSITWQEVTTYIKSYDINNNALYFKMEFGDSAGFLNLRSEGLDGKILISVYY